MMILHVRFEVLGELLDPSRQQGDLHFNRAGVLLVSSVLLDNLRFLGGTLRHGIFSSIV
jgi:hypothetical protein